MTGTPEETVFQTVKPWHPPQSQNLKTGPETCPALLLGSSFPSSPPSTHMSHTRAPKPLTCQAARPLEGGGGIQLLRMLAVLLGRVDQALGGRQGGVGADGGAQLVDGRRGDGGLHGGGRGHADRGQAGRGHDDVDGRAGAVGLGQAAGRLLGRGAARRGVGGTLGGRASALQLGGRAALRGGQRGAPARRRGQRGAGVVERRGGGRRVGQVEGAAQAGRERLPRRRRRWRRLGARQVPRAAGRALCRESREQERSEVEKQPPARPPAPPGCRGQLLRPGYGWKRDANPRPSTFPARSLYEEKGAG